VGDNCLCGRVVVDETMMRGGCIDKICFVVMDLGDGMAWTMIGG
jgi:hypothetical protein